MARKYLARGQQEIDFDPLGGDHIDHHVVRYLARAIARQYRSVSENNAGE